MARLKLSPSEIVDRLQAIDALTADGWPVAKALDFAGVLPDDYDKWRTEYLGLLRTLGPVASVPPHGARPWRRGRSRPPV